VSAVKLADLEGKRAVVVGLGASGVAACRLLVSRGAKVTGTDKVIATSHEAEELAALGVTLALGGHEAAGLAGAALIVVSPGVPSFAELEAAARAGVPVWGEVELAVRAVNAAADAAGRKRPRLVAIGGTNGKSTVTSLIGAVLELAGLRTFVGGNLGEPLAAHADEIFDALVLEVSSFQMERVDAFHPEISVLLNVTPDHLDRYPDLSAYADAKGNAFLRQTEHDVAVVPVDDATCLAQAARGHGRVVTFGAGGTVDVHADAVVDHRARVAYARSQFGIQGGHNALNVAAAVAALGPFQLDKALVASVLERFRGLPHRMALVRELDGVRYYDDSKGTNVGAAVTAVRGVSEPKVVLIAGGRDKGGTYAPLGEALRDRGRALVLLGEAAAQIADAVGDAVPTRRAASMEAAVQAAADLARPGDAVLLSPACSSFDMFRDYKHRGDAFVAAVLALRGRSA
jgi:UDP-N-acetylmuramoylalanine--D-glutamate ligase